MADKHDRLVEMTFEECFKKMSDEYGIEDGDFFNPDELQDWCHDAWNEARRTDPEKEKLQNLLREIADSGVELDDPRMRYVVVQIYREDWEQLQKETKGA